MFWGIYSGVKDNTLLLSINSQLLCNILQLHFSIKTTKTIYSSIIITSMGNVGEEGKVSLKFGKCIVIRRKEGENGATSKNNI